jgi:hypothetical protein
MFFRTTTEYRAIPTVQQWLKDYGVIEHSQIGWIRSLLEDYHLAPTAFAKNDILAKSFWLVDDWLAKAGPKAKNAAVRLSPKDAARLHAMTNLYKIIVSKLCEFFRVTVNVLPSKLALSKLKGSFVEMGEREDGEDYELGKTVMEEFRLRFDGGYVTRWKDATRSFIATHTADADLRFKSTSMFLPPAYNCQAGYVMAMWDSIYMAEHDVKKNRYHSQYMSGERVRCAGEMTIVQGRVASVSNLSGHYLPRAEQLLPVLWYLQQQGTRLTSVNVFAMTVEPPEQVVRTGSSTPVPKPTSASPRLPTAPSPTKTLVLTQWKGDVFLRAMGEPTVPVVAVWHSDDDGDTWKSGRAP